MTAAAVATDLGPMSGPGRREIKLALLERAEWFDKKGKELTDKGEADMARPMQQRASWIRNTLVKALEDQGDLFAGDAPPTPIEEAIEESGAPGGPGWTGFPLPPKAEKVEALKDGEPIDEPKGKAKRGRGKRNAELERLGKMQDTVDRLVAHGFAVRFDQVQSWQQEQRDLADDFCAAMDLAKKDGHMPSLKELPVAPPFLLEATSNETQRVEKAQETVVETVEREAKKKRSFRKFAKVAGKGKKK